MKTQGKNSRSLPFLLNGEKKLVWRICKARRLNEGKGYSLPYVIQVLNKKDKRFNPEIVAVAREVEALRKGGLPTTARRPTARTR